MEYDYLIVGAGLFGSVFVHEAAKRGKRCLVIDRRSHIAGNCYCETIEGIHVHTYGAHIFHTSNQKIWDYVNQFSEFNNFVLTTIANYKDQVYNLPFNMNTFSKMWGIKHPSEAKEIIENQISGLSIMEPRNLEEQAIALVGKDIFERLIKGYVEKQWGRDAKELPAFIIKRLPLRFTYNNNYYYDKYQGIPIGGYNSIVEQLLSASEVMLNTEYKKFIKENPNIAKRTIYTGIIDEFFDYQLGVLQYRSVQFDTKVMDCENYQGCAVMSFTEREIPYTRIIEHKHFEFGNQPKTVVSYEYSKEWNPGDEPYYPINDDKNNALYQKYQQLAQKLPDVLFAGRLGEYRYYDMDKVIQSALDLVSKEIN